MEGSQRHSIVERLKGIITDIVDDDLVVMRKQGKSWREIGCITNIPFMTVRRRVNEKICI